MLIFLRDHDRENDKDRESMGWGKEGENIRAGRRNRREEETKRLMKKKKDNETQEEGDRDKRKEKKGEKKEKKKEMKFLAEEKIFTSGGQISAKQP